MQYFENTELNLKYCKRNAACGNGVVFWTKAWWLLCSFQLFIISICISTCIHRCYICTYSNKSCFFIAMSTNLWFEMKSTKLCSKMLLVNSSENNSIFLPAFYLIMCLMKASKNFEKIAILKTQDLVSFLGSKTHFGKLALKWCIFRLKEGRL